MVVDDDVSCWCFDGVFDGVGPSPRKRGKNGSRDYSLIIVVLFFVVRRTDQDEEKDEDHVEEEDEAEAPG